MVDRGPESAQPSGGSEPPRSRRDSRIAWIRSRDVEGLFAPWHLLIVLVVALLVFGPSKLPEVGRQMGRGLAEFRKFRDSFDDDLRGFLGHDEDEHDEDENEKPEPSGRELPPANPGRKPPLPEGRD
jgi:sec-independent protein translocase protein TatA